MILPVKSIVFINLLLALFSFILELAPKSRAACILGQINSCIIDANANPFSSDISGLSSVAKHAYVSAEVPGGARGFAKAACGYPNGSLGSLFHQSHGEPCSCHGKKQDVNP